MSKTDSLDDSADLCADPRGSMWRRWDPHLHTPGTAFNDQFPKSDGWERWLTAVESATPRIEALGITDYWSIDNYEKVLGFWKEGRLPNVKLIFPNIELRLAVGTLEKGRAINVHLLVCPDDPHHVKQARRLLGTLKFKYRGEEYHCTPDDLIALGKAHNPKLTDESGALTVGLSQFKVSPDVLHEALSVSKWAKDNVLIAVAAGTGDGMAGLQKEHAFEALRQEIERQADVIFSANPNDRAFWVGKGKKSEQEILDTYGSLKPCLHGSDAHKLEEVGAPAEDRYQWIKGDATFESLRQACIEPETRVWIGRTPPSNALPHRTIDRLNIENAPWATTPDVPLNPGLVGIIGARGSGKTALADLIAATAGCTDHLTNERSFLSRAAAHLTAVSVRLDWGDGEQSRWPRTGSDGSQESAPGDGVQPAVQYLSQQFVERLCTAEGGLADELLAEIERVIYEEHSPEARTGTSSFAELRTAKTEASRIKQQRSADAIKDIASDLQRERSKQHELLSLDEQRQSLEQRIKKNQNARRALTVSGEKTRTQRLAKLTRAVEERKEQLGTLERQLLSLRALKSEVEAFMSGGVHREEERLRTLYSVAGLTAQEWRAFRLRFEGDVEEIINRRIAKVEQAKETIANPGGGRQSTASAASKDLDKLPLRQLETEIEQLKKEIGLDQRKREQLTKLDKSILDDQTALSQLRSKIKDAQQAGKRIADLRKRWYAEYRKAFAAIEAQEEALRELYEPLASAIEAESGLVKKLSFVVRREVDLELWASQGEDLLDLRKGGPFRGKGRLLEVATEELGAAWKTGSAADVSRAMKRFRDQYDEALAEHSPVSPDDRAAYDAWGNRISQWLASIEHITIRYGIQYEGVDIERLSPGTRGIVLLLLYLAIDRNDDRPLIIDQPEENLDPQSVFEELVGRFRSVRERRQVVIVTHNANLVVNTDADQVIVASAKPAEQGKLPRIAWRGGGLENPKIRKQVCAILEGGEQAFVQRARRLRIPSPRAS